MIKARIEDYPCKLGIQIEGFSLKHSEYWQQAALAEGRKHRFLQYQFESNLALGEIELVTEQERAAQMRLLAFEKESRAKGFASIVNRVAAVR